MKANFIFMNRPSDAALARACQTLVNGLDARLRDMGCDTELVLGGIIPKKRGEDECEAQHVAS